MASEKTPPVILFGYESSPFTNKVRLVLRIKQIPYTFIEVPSMMPRPLLRQGFHLTYRKIPVLAIGREVYCDTSLIIEALEHFFSDGFASIYPLTADGRSYRPLIRAMASYWTDRPLFRVMTGLIPESVWHTSFGIDRAALIGHKLDPIKLGAKRDRNLAGLDTQLSLLESLFLESNANWVLSTEQPSLADVSLYYQLDWGNEISAGRGIENLTGGGTKNTNHTYAEKVFNADRYPGLCAWFADMKAFIDRLPTVEIRAKAAKPVLQHLSSVTIPPAWTGKLLPTPQPVHQKLNRKLGLSRGTRVSIAPDDTGRDDPTYGTIVAISPEEVIIKPEDLELPPWVRVNVHFPRIGFVVAPVLGPKL